MPNQFTTVLWIKLYKERTAVEHVNPILNPYVKAVNDKSISYTDEFKQFFIDEYEKGKSPREIFLEAGFDIDIIGMTRVKK